MRRRTLLVALAGLAVVVAAGVVVLWPRPAPEQITRENYDRIRVGWVGYALLTHKGREIEVERTPRFEQ